MKRLTATLLALLLAPTLALADVPVRVRILKGARQGPALLDPKLEDLKKQLGKLVYQRWEQVSEQPPWPRRPSSWRSRDLVGLTVQEVRGDTVTVEVALAQRNAMSRLTIEKGQRIVHQVTGEKAGVAYFVTVTAWP
jgi:hypothetical protein